MPGDKSARRRGVLLVLVATVLWSLAGLFARLLVHLDVWTVMGWRALLGAASIAAVGLIEWRNGRLENPLGFGALSPLVRRRHARHTGAAAETFNVAPLHIEARTFEPLQQHVAAQPPLGDGLRPGNEQSAARRIAVSVGDGHFVGIRGRASARR